MNKKLNIRVLNAVAIALLIALVIIAVSVGNIKKETSILRSRSMDTSIVRLHDADTGRFFCSGVIISKTRLLTAAHCVIQESIFGLSKVDRVEVRFQDGKAINLFAEVEAANPRQDLAILKGDFRGTDKREVVSNSSELNRIFMDTTSKIVACGFPDAGPLRCSKLSKVGRALFFFSADAWLYPGMSGGPVIDGRTGAVLAVNQAVTPEGRVIVSPLIELFDNLGLNETPSQQ